MALEEISNMLTQFLDVFNSRGFSWTDSEAGVGDGIWDGVGCLTVWEKVGMLSVFRTTGALDFVSIILFIFPLGQEADDLL